MALSIIAAGTFAWFSLVQSAINEFEFVPADIRLIKYEIGTEHPLAGAVFELFDENNSFVGRYITDADGEILLDNLDSSKKYYFKEIQAPAGYQIQGAGTTAMFSPGGGDIIVYNDLISSRLLITKTIGDTDISGTPYTPTPEELRYPFAFTVTIGDNTAAEYDYEIRGADENLIAPYSYTMEDNSVLQVSAIGKLRNGGKLYLRHGETAIVAPVPSLVHYTVTEKCYAVSNYDQNALAAGEFGCEDNHVHDTVIGTLSGWFSTGNNTVGNILQAGSQVTFVNRRIPLDYKITMSSLALVDRILAHPDDIDPGKGFEVTVLLGDDPNQTYYYDVVHTQEVSDLLPDYDLSYAYYSRNDPGLPPPITLGAPALVPLPDPPQTLRTYATPKPPLHDPSDYERWQQTGGKPLPALRRSAGNTITENLHHDSTLIIYGIPVGTHYTAQQKDYRYVDGYMLAETKKAEGDILPDLDVLPDPDSDDPLLLRVRTDFYNYFTEPLAPTLTIHKKWESEGDPNPPTETEVELIDRTTGVVYDSRVRLTSWEDWKKTVTVPKYDPITGKPIDYGIAEKLPPDYVISGMEETDDGFVITNTYAPTTVKPLIIKRISGGKPAKWERFTFVLTPETPGAPMPPSGGEKVTVTDGGVNFFGNIKYDTVGSYLYSITEQMGNAEGYTYDESVYRLKVLVKENAEGKLTAIPVYTLDGDPVSTPLVFTNHYAGSGSLEVTKQAVGVGADPEKLFRFAVEIEGKEPQSIWLKSGEKKIFENIPIGTKYKVTEDDYTTDGYVTTAKGDTGVITIEGAKAQFVNTNNTPRPTANLTITKRVQGDGADKTKRFNFTVTIGGFKYLITLADGESYTFTNIPIGTAYLVEEAKAHGYSTTSDGSSGTIPTSGVTASFINSKGDVSPDDKGKLTVTKTVTGRFVDTTKRFRFTVKIGDQEHTFSLRHGESKSFDNIPAGTSYAVYEDSYSSMGYVTSSTGAVGTIVKGDQTAKFTNEYISATPPQPEDDAVQISGQKTWAHGTNPESSRPQSITVYVMNGTAIVAEKTVTAEEGWAYAFNLPKQDAEGKEIIYSVNEGDLAGYSKSISGYNITNTYAPGGGDDGPDTSDTALMLPWFLLLIAGTVGLRTAIFYKSKRRGRK